MQEAADALMANQGAIVNSIIERTRHEATDDEREAQANRYIAGHGDSQTRRDFLAGWDAALRRYEVPEPGATELRQVQYDDGSWSRTLEGAPAVSDEGWSTKDRREAIAEGDRRWNVESQHSLVEQRDHDLYGMGARNGFILGAEWWKLTHRRRSEPQGEPSDAQVLAALNARWKYDPPYDDIADWSVESVENMRASLRAAWNVR